MLSESEKRAALLAVSRYGADASRIFAVVQSVLDARSRGEIADLLDAFEQKSLLTLSQARELRFGLEKTLVDPVSKNGSAAKDPYAAETLQPSEPATGEEESTETPIELHVLGDYRILRRLGEGGTGAVFQAYHQKENRHVAIKVLAPHLAKNQGSLDRFYREAKSGALLNHPNIVRNLAAGQDQLTGMHYLILEYVDGPSALDLLDKFQRMPVGDALHIVLDIARALEHAHSRNIVHRDIKPSNILITLSGLAKLADMGLAKRTDETSHLTHARQGFGTPYYMPYEQAMNAKYADARSDIYALGATLYHLVAGEVPFSGSTSLEIVDKKGIGTFTPASEVNPDVPRALDVIMAKMLAREPRDRYQTVSELIVDLERSNLAAALPSFIDPDRAMQDPVVRQRLAAPAATCPDLRPGLDRPLEADQIWYLRYNDRHGQPCKAKLTQAQVVQRLRDGKLTPRVEAARLPRGDFQPLASYAEFQHVITSLLKPRLTKSEPKEDFADAAEVVSSYLGWWIALAAAIGIIFLLVVTVVLWLRLS